jgi:phage terminase large subunit-like protein
MQAAMTRFVVAAQNGVAGAGEKVADPLDAHTLGRLHRVHVAAEKDRSKVEGTGKADDQVAAFRTGAAARVVFDDCQGIEFAENLLQAL